MLYVHSPLHVVAGAVKKDFAAIIDELKALDKSLFVKIVNRDGAKMLEKVLGILLPMHDNNGPDDLSVYEGDTFLAKLVPVIPKLYFVEKPAGAGSSGDRVFRGTSFGGLASLDNFGSTSV